MTKQVQLAVRVRADTRDAVAAAARDDMRSMAAKVELILRAWVVENGYLPEPAKPGTVGRLSTSRRPAPAAPAPEPEPAETVPAAHERPQRRRRNRDAPR